MSTPRLQLSTSLFSFAYEWNSGEYTFESLLAKLRGLGVGPGLEVVGFQSFRGFPHLSEAALGEVRELLARYEFVPTCLDANSDIALRRDRRLNTDEMVDYLRPQLQVAATLGFPVLRVQMMAGPDVLRRLLPLAEQAGVKLGLELHTPYSVQHPAVLALRELMEELDSPYLGFIPDFGTSMRTIPAALLHSFREVGVTDELIAVTREIWQQEVPTPAKFGELQARATALGATPPQIGRLNMAFSMNGRQRPADWTEIVPRTVHLHGKFYGFDAAGDEPSIDYAAIIKVFYEGGYRGYLSSEYEGSAFTDEFTAFDMVEKHQALCRRILADLENNDK